MRVMWTVNDPLGNRIQLTRRCWEHHILVEHPIMRQFSNQVRTTVQRPDLIFRSKVSAGTRLYFRQYFRRSLGRFYIMVIVGTRKTKQRGFVKTAFLVYNLSKGGTLLWQRS
jgi:hypothetical protein